MAPGRLREQHPTRSSKPTWWSRPRPRDLQGIGRLADGASATGWGSEYREQFPNFIEAAETKALGRALAALGFGRSSRRSRHRRGGFGSPTRRFALYAVGENGSQQQYQSSYQQAELEPTDRQRKLIDVLRSQLNLSADELDEIATSTAARR